MQSPRRTSAMQTPRQAVQKPAQQRPPTIDQLKADTDRALVGEEESDPESDTSEDPSDEEDNNIRQEPTPTITPPPNNGTHCTELYKLLEEKLAGFKSQLDEQARQIEQLKRGQKTNGPNEPQRMPETSLAKTQPRQSKGHQPKAAKTTNTATRPIKVTITKKATDPTPRTQAKGQETDVTRVSSTMENRIIVVVINNKSAI
ncbi:hypothetical protein SeLEV6574_g08401 [Synchytrium endobioticum]|uniref:Uncharacterized protein n=1 Tax=Synchytrium endobioticum TaxID=286115 RepID=A0A507C5L1_9FUNG|nr:hypothetical protein SeLEV6574_g08401 [Synchytrium endobioticum]